MIYVKVRTGDDGVRRSVPCSFCSHVLALLDRGGSCTCLRCVCGRGGQQQRAPAMVPVLSQRLRFCSVGPTDSYVRALEGWADWFGFGLSSSPDATVRCRSTRREARREAGLLSMASWIELTRLRRRCRGPAVVAARAPPARRRPRRRIRATRRAGGGRDESVDVLGRVGGTL